MEHASFFGAEQIPMHNLSALEESIPNLLAYGIPLMILCLAIEYFLSYKNNGKNYDRRETVGTILVAAGNITIGLLLKFVLFLTLVLLYNAVPWRMEFAWWTLIPCYIVFDFFSYCSHYISHTQRFWWATHVVHHSSQDYNFTIAFRLSWLEYLKLIFLLPVSFMGFHPVIVLVVNQIAVLYQFWVHTEYIPKLPRIIEYIFVTPSSHRVHHASQPHYMNKNFGSTFIIWDRLFGTYQAEEEHPRYGITHHLDSKVNPFHINFHEYKAIIEDVKKAKGLKECFFLIFGDPIQIDQRKQLLKKDLTEK
jgi:sterol desaturase/sphingolipid hydroxylase (fatty acid hydroxylase superfamily)